MLKRAKAKLASDGWRSGGNTKKDPNKSVRRTFDESEHLFSKIVQNAGCVPLFPAAAQLGKVVACRHEAALAISVLARRGECRNRQRREAVERIPLVPISQEQTRGALFDVLPLHPKLVRAWLRWRGIAASSDEGARKNSMVRGISDVLFFLFCAGFGERFMLPDSVRPLSRRQEAMLEHL